MAEENETPDENEGGATVDNPDGDTGEDNTVEDVNIAELVAEIRALKTLNQDLESQLSAQKKANSDLLQAIKADDPEPPADDPEPAQHPTDDDIFE